MSDEKVEVVCPACGRKGRAPAGKLGTEATWSQCRTVFTLTREPTSPVQRTTQVIQPQPAYVPPPPGVFGELLNVVLLFGVWGLVLVGAAACVLGVFADNVLHTGAGAGVACFCGIVARVLQAELHRRPR